MFLPSRWIVIPALALVLGGCATGSTIDYSAFRENMPRSILVLPPLNNSPDLRATYSVLSTVTRPLAEDGYYVFPVALVDQTFRENGLTIAGEIHQVPLDRLREIFGADATLYLTVTRYGPVYMLIGSEVRVTVTARLVDNRTGQVLWAGAATASDSEGGNSGRGSLAAILIYALAKHLVSNIGDQGHPIARITSQRLLSVRPNGLLYGPLSPYYEKAAP